MDEGGAEGGGGINSGGTKYFGDDQQQQMDQTDKTGHYIWAFAASFAQLWWVWSS